MINFNEPLSTGREIGYIQEAIENRKICGDGIFTKKCNKWLADNTGAKKALLTTSCSHAIEMAVLLCGIYAGDEVIMPSYNFSSSANAVALRGATAVFVDIRPDTMNIDEEKIESAITDKTKAIIVVHYAGVSCEMNRIMELAEQYRIKVIEDAAQGMMCSYYGKPLGSIGDFGCYSFHETKNYTMGEGGALLINDGQYIEPAEIIREKGTDRSKFCRGQIDKYTWVGIGSSYLPSDLNAAYLWPQLEVADKINERRMTLWNQYYESLSVLKENNIIDLPSVPIGCVHNGHMFYIKVNDVLERSALISYLKDRDIQSQFHYLPLHTSTGGIRYGKCVGDCEHTMIESERLLRLPMHFYLSEGDVCRVCNTIKEFYGC